jgi:tRNA-Thr(GGU) m(6)t(6)A37 methyltransferase TsaA
MNLSLQPIGVIQTPYKQKFAIPRQPGLVNSALGQIIFHGQCNDPNYIRGIEQFSHLWLVFHFHQTADKGHSALVRPPRLGGNKKQGVFATRSTFRPNSLGMSVVELVSVQHHQGQLSLTVKGMDLLDGTPIIDIKPYLAYSDSIEGACGGMAQQAPVIMPVNYSREALAQIDCYLAQHPQLKELISQVLGQDPRPAYHNKTGSDKTYGMSLYHYNIVWQVIDGLCHVLSISALAESSS